jgi:transposase
MDDMLMADVAAEAESARTTDRKSARMRRVEVITRGEQRRTWTTEQKRGIVLESLAPAVRPSDVARRHGINTGLLYTWRRQMLDGQLGEVVRAMPDFARVDLAPPVPRPEAMVEPPAMSLPSAEPPSPAAPARPQPAGLIEVVLPGGVCVRVDTQGDGRALRRVLGALEGR